ncbi:MAG: YdeI/OmpD-associated family protein [Paenisporosarcina sp.]|nr:YdeI/OmpD-associated family protein [Paenisporosarcina sp.]
MILENKQKLKIPSEQRLLVMESPLPDYVTAEMDTQPKDGLYSFGLLFATSINHLHTHEATFFKALNEDAMIWIAYPKKSSKLFKNLNRDFGWEVVQANGFAGIASIALDVDWSAMRFRPQSDVKRKTSNSKQVVPVNYEMTEEIRGTFERQSVLEAFENLPFGYQKQYLEWLLSAKRQETKDKRLVEAVDKLRAGFRQPYGK